MVWPPNSGVPLFRFAAIFILSSGDIAVFASQPKALVDWGRDEVAGPTGGW